MEIFLIRLLQFMLAISILVLLHEGGHFFFAKLFGVRVEKFYLFFDPWFHLFEFKPKKSDTTYGVGWLPLGGYCKISGMIDESFDTEQMKKPAQPWEFRSKPAWQRLLIMVGGVLVNFLLALFIYAMVLFTWGDSYYALGDMKMGMKFNESAKEIGFRDGDILLRTDEKTFDRFDVDMYRAIANAKTVTVSRQGKEVTLTMPDDMSLLTMVKEQPVFTRPFIPADVDSVLSDSPAQKAGMMKGDKLLAIGGKPIDSWNEFDDQIGRMQDVLAAAKTKRHAMARLRRMVLWAYLGLTPADVPERVPYLRVLAANDTGCRLLAEMRTSAAAPVLTKPAQVRQLGPEARRLFAHEVRATDLYTLAYPRLEAAEGGTEWREGPVILGGPAPC